MPSPNSTKEAILKCWPTIGLTVKTYGAGRWALATSAMGNPMAFLRIGPAWHGWDAEGSWSGYAPNDYKCLGDVAGSDSQLRTYEKHVAECPTAISRILSIR